MEPLFEMDHVGLIDGDTVVLADVCAKIVEGGITVLTGPSGSGKSTLLRLFNRLTVPTSGIVRFRGDPLDQLDPVALRRQVGMVFQRPTTFDGTCLDNLQAACAPREELTHDHAAVMLARVGLNPEIVDRDSRVLSGGEAQRLCLARTLVTNCEVLLADEPTSSLDAASANVLERLARELADSGMTVVWVTHDDAQADRLADHRLTIENGRVDG